MRERIEHPGLFTAEYTRDTLPKLTPVLLEDLKYQINNRYLTETPNFEPTEKERRWGIESIPPENTYWMHFKNRLDNDVIKVLQNDPRSNKAVVTIDYPSDPPCFQSFHFKVVDGHIELTCFARSLDLINGLPVDVHIFFYAALEIVSLCVLETMKNCVLIIVSAGAHVYIETEDETV